MRIAIVGTGISGLVCAHLLDPDHDVTVFEADSRVGGHTNTVDVEVPGARRHPEHHAVDTGFIVFNDRNYPNFIRLLERLGVATQPSEMSFSVSNELTGLEYRGTNLNTLYAQRANLLKPSFTRMLVDILRFNRQARRAASADGRRRRPCPLADFVDAGRLLAGASATTSSCRSARRSGRPTPRPSSSSPPPPTAGSWTTTACSSCAGIPQWRTVTGGSQQYVEALTARLSQPVRVELAGHQGRAHRRRRPPARHRGRGRHRHPRARDLRPRDPGRPQRPEPRAARRPDRRRARGPRRHPLPAQRRHAAHRLAPAPPRAPGPGQLELPPRRRLGPGGHTHLLDEQPPAHRVRATTSSSPSTAHDEIDRSTVLAEFEYDHPVFDAAAMAAQRRRPEIQGDRGTYFAGAYWGYGFHEDGVVLRPRRVPPLRRGAVTRRRPLYAGATRHRRFAPKPHTARASPLYLVLLDHDELDRPDGPIRRGGPLRPEPLVARALPPHRLPRRRPTDPARHAVRDLVEARTGRRPARPGAARSPRCAPRATSSTRSPCTTAGPGTRARRAAGARGRRARGHQHAVERAPLVRGRRPPGADPSSGPGPSRRRARRPGPPARRDAKAMHVSPFMPMEQTYRLTCTAPGAAHSGCASRPARTAAMREPAKVFDADLALRREPLTRARHGPASARATRSPPIGSGPASTPTPSSLAAKRVPFFAHPDRSRRPSSRHQRRPHEGRWTAA